VDTALAGPFNIKIVNIHKGVDSDHGDFLLNTLEYVQGYSAGTGVIAAVFFAAGGDYSNAGEELALSQPAVSRQVAGLELTYYFFHPLLVPSSGGMYVYLLNNVFYPLTNIICYNADSVIGIPMRKGGHHAKKNRH